MNLVIDYQFPFVSLYRHGLYEVLYQAVLARPILWLKRVVAVCQVINQP